MSGLAGWRGGSQGGERGSQAVEFALVVPAVLMLFVLVVHAGLAAADLVAVQAVAWHAARMAAVTDDAAALAAAERAAGRRAVDVRVEPRSGARVPGQLVTATVRLRSRAFSAFGVPLWVPAQATARVESP